jgi:hypothetical protein
MGIILLSVFLGLVAVAALSGTPAIAAYIIFPLSFGANSNLNLNPQSSITRPSPDTRTVEASARYLAGPEPQLAPDLVHGALTGQRWFQGDCDGSYPGTPACLRADQPAALQIQQAIAGFDDGQFQADSGSGGRSVEGGNRRSRSAATGSAESVVCINPNSSVRRTSGPGRGSSTNTAGGFGVAGRNQPAWGTSRTAAVPVNSSR